MCYVIINKPVSESYSPAALCAERVIHNVCNEFTTLHQTLAQYPLIIACSKRLHTKLEQSHATFGSVGQKSQVF